MKQVSQAYIDTINQDIRPPSQFRGTLKLRDDSVAEHSVVLYPTATNFSTGILDNKHNGDYIALEQDFFQIGAGQLILPETDDFIDSGYVSEKMANTSGSFSTLQQFTIEKKLGASLKKFNAVRYSFSGAYPKEIEVSVYLNEVLQKKFTSVPTGLQFTDNENHIPLADKIVFVFKKLNKPNQRLRVNSIGFGDDLVFDMSNIISVTHEKSIDPISQRLPTNKLTMTVENFNKQFNPDNPQGVYEYLTKKQPFVVEYGVITQEKTATQEQVIEWIKTDTLLLSDKPKITNRTAVFEATDVLSTLDWSRYPAEFNKASTNLYDLASTILSYAGITKYRLDPRLSNVSTNAVIPDVPIRELLQLIAGTTGVSKLYCDADGYIVIDWVNYIDPPYDDAYYLDNTKVIGNPVSKPTEQLKDCIVKYTENSLKEATETIFKGDITIKGNGKYGIELVEITFDNTADLFVITKNASLALVTPHSATIICAGLVGEKKRVVVTGRKIQTLNLQTSKNFNTFGKDCIINNPLVTFSKDAEFLAKAFGNYLNNRYSYDLQIRQDFRLECCDRIFVQTEFTEKAPAIITKLKYQLPGQKGSVTVRRIGE